MFFSSWVVAIYFLLYTHEFCHDFRYICIHLGILGSQYKIWALEEESEHCRPKFGRQEEKSRSGAQNAGIGSDKMGGRVGKRLLSPIFELEMGSQYKIWAIEEESEHCRPKFGRQEEKSSSAAQNTAIRPKKMGGRHANMASSPNSPAQNKSWGK